MRHSSDYPDVSVIIPCKNAQSVIGRQLESLLAQTDPPSFEVIISDNGCTDQTVAVALSYRDGLDIRIVDSSERKGASAARNIGTTEARSSTLVFFDADDEVSPQCLRELYSAHLSSPTATITGALDYWTRNELEVAYAYGVVKDLTSTSRDRALEDARSSEEFSLCGGIFLTTRDTWDLLGGMREDLPYGAEDLDFGQRVTTKGLPLLRAKDAVLYYRLRRTPRELFSQQAAWARSRARLGATSDMPGSRRPSLKGSFGVFIRTAAPPFRIVNRRHVRLRYFHDLGIAFGRLQGAVFEYIEERRTKLL